jgi:AraC-like DNA-binding protein
MLFAENTVGRHTVSRTRQHIAQGSDDLVIIPLISEGTCAVFQDGREAVIGAGEFALIDVDRPYKEEVGTSMQSLVALPRQMLTSRIGEIGDLTATTLRRVEPLAGIAFDMLTGLSRAAGRLAPEITEYVSNQALDVLALAIGERLGRKQSNPSGHRTLMRLRVKNYIQAHLNRAELTLDEVARASGISPRYIHSLLADEQTSFRQYVLGLRLEHCRRALASPVHRGRSIGEIAYSWGFNDLAHFSRAFRARFSTSPREWRQHCRESEK